jgi:CBS domain-containing protein
VTVGPDTELEHASELMAHYDTSHAVVSEGAGGRPVGIVSSMDIASAIAAD